MPPITNDAGLAMAVAALLLGLCALVVPALTTLAWRRPSGSSPTTRCPFCGGDLVQCVDVWAARRAGDVAHTRHFHEHQCTRCEGTFLEAMQ